MGFFVWAPVASATFASAATAPAPATPTYTVAMTAYNAVPGQTDSDPNTTASGAYSDPDIIAARSVDLADELPFGTVIEVTAASSSVNCGYKLVDDQIGLRVIGDSMNARMHNKIDILFDANDTVRARGRQMNPALALGICDNVEIKVVGSVDIRRIPKTQDELRLAIGYLPKAADEKLAVKQ
jgi:3D (Asp-Asp-Asp) domain-containing protein